MKRVLSAFEKSFEWLTQKIATVLGHSVVFMIALLIAITWIGLDIFYSNTLHDFINDCVFAFTFLMLFIIQKMQNKFATVINIKLNELVASHENASNRLIKAEDMTEQELRKLAAHYETLSAHLGKNSEMVTSASIEHVIEEIKEDIAVKKEEEKTNS